ncbi:MAG: hypothetical protein ACW99G_11585 [Candidatus Thorarchaeota archaeon]
MTQQLAAEQQTRGMKKGTPINQLYNNMKDQMAMKRDYTANQRGLSIALDKEPTEAELEAKWKPQTDALDELLNKVDLDAEPDQESVLNSILSKVDIDGDMDGDTENGRDVIPLINLEGIGSFPMTKLFHSQIASHLKIPKIYYDRMLHGDKSWEPERIEETKEARHKLLVDNLNAWLNMRADEMRMVRTMGGRARAYLSNAYRCIDNFDLAAAVISEVLQLNEEEDMQITCVSADVSDDYMHLKFTTPKLQGVVRPGDRTRADDIVQAGLVIRNSEVGLASVSVEPMIVRLVCWNGAVMEFAIKRRHVGSRQGLGDTNVEELLSDATKKLSDQALMAKVRDVVRGSLREDIFYGNLEILKAANDRPLNYKGKDVSGKAVVEEIAKRHSFSDKEGDNILNAYMKTIEGTGQTQWGVANAVTLAAGGSKTYDRASEIERIGGSILKMDDKSWESLMANAS